MSYYLEDFEKRMFALIDKENSIQDEMRALQEEYEKNYYLQKGDRCIDRNGKMCWFSRINWGDCHSIGGYDMVCYPKKDGSPSNIEEYAYDLKKVKE